MSVTGFSDTHLEAVEFNGSVFCAIDWWYGYSCISSDGITWTKYAIPFGLNLGRCLAWNGSVFCITGTGTHIATSPDGITWTVRTGILNSAGPIVWNGSVFFTFKLNTTSGQYSTDGVTWTAVTLPMKASMATVRGGIVCIVSDTFGDIYRSYSATSTNGSTWTLSSGTITPTVSSLFGMGESPSKFVVSIGSYTATSTDGLTWTLSGLSSIVFERAIWTGTAFIAPESSSAGNHVYTSADGLTWGTSSLASGGKNWASIAYGLVVPPISPIPPLFWKDLIQSTQTSAL
jgi:hypothetical protein